MFDSKLDFWTLKSAEAILKAHKAAKEGDAKKLAECNSAINFANEKIRELRKGKKTQ